MVYVGMPVLTGLLLTLVLLLLLLTSNWAKHLASVWAGNHPVVLGEEKRTRKLSNICILLKRGIVKTPNQNQQLRAARGLNSPSLTLPSSPPCPVTAGRC